MEPLALGSIWIRILGSKMHHTETGSGLDAVKQDAQASLHDVVGRVLSASLRPEIAERDSGDISVLLDITTLEGYSLEIRVSPGGYRLMQGCEIEEAVSVCAIRSVR